MRIFLSGLVVLVAAVLIGVFRILPAHVDNDMNRVHPHAPYPISGQASDLHEALRVANVGELTTGSAEHTSAGLSHS